MIKLLFTVGILASLHAFGQVTTMDFEQYDPPSTLIVEEHKITKAKFPFVDIHNHQNNLSPQQLRILQKEMDKMNMQVMVNLSGSNGDRLNQSLQNIKATLPNRFLVFANVDFNGVGQADWSNKAAAQLEQDIKNGAAGLKIFKSLGLSVKDNNGKRVTVDDERLDAIWQTCAKYKIPVLIHTADPERFWQPMDAQNERWLELKTHPGRRRGADNPAPFEVLIEEQHRLFRKHPNTTFIAAHFGWYANDLNHLSKLLDEMKNVVVEFGAVIAELGRQPKAAKAFFIKYQNRILFGKDSWVPEEYNTYFRVLETEDEYFPYHKKYHAFWRMYGMGLPDEVLKKIYYKNAVRILPQIDATQFPK